MSIRIIRIKVNRGGPLASDFEMQPGNLNLIYGPNESGKTYLVEALIKFLFKTNKRAPVDWPLREWDLTGRAVVSGLKESPVTFTKTGDKIEGHWEERLGLPGDLSRLLVVRAGETALAKGGDGVGRDMLRGYLSGEGLLDRVSTGIQTTVRDARIEGSQILGHQRGELQQRSETKEKLERLQGLLVEVEGAYASGEAGLLRQREEDLKTEIETMGRAKRYHATNLASQISSQLAEKGALPSERELALREADIRSWRTNLRSVAKKSERLAEIAGDCDNAAWARSAVDVYKDVTSRGTGGRPNRVFAVLTMLSLIGTVAFGLFGDRALLIVTSLAAVTFGALAYRDLKKLATSAGEVAELEKLKSEYRMKFGSELTDRAKLEAKLAELMEIEGEATRLKEDKEALHTTMEDLERGVSEDLLMWNGREVPSAGWEEVIRDLRESHTRLDENVRSLRGELTKLGVSDDDYVEDDPGQSWDPDRYEDLRGEFGRVADQLEGKDDELRTLRTRVIGETGHEHSDWEALIAALCNKREETAREYRAVTAGILAGIQVNGVVEEYRREENLMIETGLVRDEVTGPLGDLTGRYRGARVEGESELVLITHDDEEYPLASLSTGAREQVFLALRMGFASISMKGKTGFLILDDAFQHSDWGRRENLVEHIRGLTRSGWQVFYFTMDNHIRDLFLKAGEGMGDGFKVIELGQESQSALSER
jgi:energy-coupling factor transporter ATP-binding protein EcfA2